MRYIKLFESLDNNLESIIDVFQDIEDKFSLVLKCKKMYEVSIRTPKYYHLEGYMVDKSIDVFYGYFDYETDRNIDWSDGDGYSVHDYSDRSVTSEPSTPYRYLTSVEIPFKRRIHFYNINLSGNADYVVGNFKDIKSEISECVRRLMDMYDFNLHFCMDRFYHNGVLYKSRRDYDIVEIDWLSDIGVDLPEGSFDINIYLS